MGRRAGRRAGASRRLVACRGGTACPGAASGSRLPRGSLSARPRNGPSASASSAHRRPRACAARSDLPRAACGMTLAHVGLAVVIAGIDGVLGLEERGGAGDAPRRGHRTSPATTSRLDCGRAIDGPNYTRGTRDRHPSCDGGDRVALLAPETRIYLASGNRPPPRRRSAPTALRLATRVIGERNDGGACTVRLYHQPAGAVDLDRRARHGAGWASLAERPAAAGRRGAARATAAERGARAAAHDRAAEAGCCSWRRRCVLLILAGWFAVALRPGRDPALAAVGADRQAGARIRPAAADRRRTGFRRADLVGQVEPRQFLRLVVRAVPRRASGADAARPAKTGRRSTASTTRTSRRRRSAWLAEFGNPFRRIGVDATGGSASTGASTACRRPTSSMPRA